MAESLRSRIDFDEWSALATNDPVRFEALRAQALDEAIRRAPPDRQHRLRCLQWRVDQVRRTSRTPIAACVRISRMMWDSVTGQGGLLENLDDLRNLRRRTPARFSEGHTATILPFQSRRMSLHVED